MFAFCMLLFLTYLISILIIYFLMADAILTTVVHDDTYFLFS